jgi:hypothetical protein
MNNRGRRKPVWILVIILLGLLGMIFAWNAGRLLVVDAPEKSDVIVVLAGETDYRPALALELFDRGYGKRVYIDVNTGYNTSETFPKPLRFKSARFRDFRRATSRTMWKNAWRAKSLIAC